MAIPIAAIVAVLEMAATITEKVIKSESEALRAKWEKDRKELAEAIKNGDLATIERISAEWADGL